MALRKSTNDILNKAYDSTNEVIKTSVRDVNIGDINITDYHTDSEPKKQPVGTSNETVTFSQDVYEVIIQNASTSNQIVYVSLDGTDATTNDFELEESDVLIVSKKIVAATGVDLIASASGAVAKLIGLWTP